MNLCGKGNKIGGISRQVVALPFTIIHAVFLPFVDVRFLIFHSPGILVEREGKKMDQGKKKGL